MHLNKKGSTLIELIISLALISVVLVFMVKMIIDINNANKNVDYAKDNQLNRAEIIRAIETDIGSKKITNIAFDNNKKELSIKNSENKTSTIKIDNASITYTPFAGNSAKRKWTMRDDVTKIVIPPKREYEFDTNTGYSSLILKIFVYTENDNNSSDEKNNVIDDITISYIGKTQKKIEFTGF